MRNIQRLVSTLIVVGLVGTVLYAAVGAALPFPTVPGGVYPFLLTPAVCVGPSCVGYAAWNRALEQDQGRRPSLVVLNALLDERAVHLVAARAGIRVSDADVNQTLHATEETLRRFPGGADLLADVSGSQSSDVLRAGVRTLLLRQKLAATGISSPWTSAFAPSVTVWNMHLAWDGAQHRVTVR